MGADTPDFVIPVKRHLLRAKFSYIIPYRGQGHSADDVAMPPFMGYKLEGSENPFSSDAVESLK